MAGLAEQRLNPPDVGAAHYALIDEIEKVADQLDYIRAAQDGWSDFNHDLHRLSPPAEIIAAWDVVGPWLNSHAGATVTELNICQEFENNLLF